MSRYKLVAYARANLVDVHRYTKRNLDEAQADAYVQALFELFGRISEGRVAGRPAIIAENVVGRVSSHRSHLVFWEVLPNGVVAIRAVLHQRMLHEDRLRIAFAEPD